MARNSLKKEDLSKVAEVVPSMDALLNTALSLAKNPNTGKVASAVSPKIRTANLGGILT
jgi:hypothetical protein